MKLETQVVSLDLAQRLKELGVKQESLFEWINDFENGVVLAPQYSVAKSRVVASAYSVAELGEILPATRCFTKMLMPGYRWYCFYTHLRDEVSFKDTQFDGDTEADARAKLLIYLIENSLMPESLTEKGKDA